ncbi:conserved hypothetical protein [Ricinus communis]|uniref:Uncharacterized protein n=1 Tax=Ricinus communis TaxID=3988 RepID=B9SZC6_RICCO|nr:conserved hypothetical protein [Ricinus communis]
MGTGGDDDELREIGEAALGLCSMKFEEIDQKEASVLEKMKTENLGIGNEGINHNPISREQRRIPHSQQFAHQDKGNLENEQESSQNLPENQEVTHSEEDIPNLVYNYKPPDIASFPGLNGLIGECSKPFEKQLIANDIEENPSRLTMSNADVAGCLVPLLDLDKHEDPKKGIEVTVYDREGNEFIMVFKTWSPRTCVLTRGWNTFLQKHKLLKHQDFVTIWIFRKLDDGDFAL